MPETKEMVFSRDVLPEWARRHPEVVELAERSVSFRADVLSARTSQYRRFLIREAKRIVQE